MKHSTSFLLLGALAASSLTPRLGAQSVAENRMYFRLGGAYHLSNLKAYMGDRAYSPIYEIGYDFKGPTETTGYGLYVSYLTGHGDPITRYSDFWADRNDYPIFDDDDNFQYRNDGLKQVLYGWRLGLDLRYRTPISGLTLFAGFNANWWDGERLNAGRVQDQDDLDHWFPIPQGSWPEGKAKVGIRMGAEYRITKHWGISWDTSLSSWLQRDGESYGQDNLTGNKAYKGINPVQPSWMNFAIQYRWSAWD
jgi:hypothetical protein